LTSPHRRLSAVTAGEHLSLTCWQWDLTVASTMCSASCILRLATHVRTGSCKRYECADCGCARMHPSCSCVQATGAIQPSAAAIQRTLWQQTQVGFLLACGLSGALRAIPACSPAAFCLGCPGATVTRGASAGRPTPGSARLLRCCLLAERMNAQARLSRCRLVRERLRHLHRAWLRSRRVCARVPDQRQRGRQLRDLHLPVLHRHDVRAHAAAMARRSVAQRQELWCPGACQSSS